MTISVCQNSKKGESYCMQREKEGDGENTKRLRNHLALSAPEPGHFHRWTEELHPTSPLWTQGSQSVLR